MGLLSFPKKLAIALQLVAEMPISFKHRKTIGDGVWQNACSPSTNAFQILLRRPCLQIACSSSAKIQAAVLIIMWKHIHHMTSLRCTAEVHKVVS